VSHGQDALWSRSTETAFTDDGERVVLLHLGEPSARPQLLVGPAAAIWRALARPGTAREVAAAVRADLSGDAVDVAGDVERFLCTLLGEGLASVEQAST
jgi:hypothetical protein